MLMSELKKLSTVGSLDCKVARAILPSETEYNHQWEQGDEKWDRLDKLSHNGIPDDKDYYSCVATQIERVCEIARRVGELLEIHNCILVTGDHGSTRLAALMFHSSDNIPITPPNDATVRMLGRFCELPDDSAITSIDSTEVVKSHNFITKCDVNCIVMKTYEHFKQSGNAVMEVHGGATPEEQLVPVIVIKRKIPLDINTTESVKKRQAYIEKPMGI